MEEQNSSTKRKKSYLRWQKVNPDQLEHSSSCQISNIRMIRSSANVYTRKKERRNEGRCEYDYYTGLSLN